MLLVFISIYPDTVQDIFDPLFSQKIFTEQELNLILGQHPDRVGYCYEWSAKYVLTRSDVRLVHGLVPSSTEKGKIVNHAWIESKDKVIDTVSKKIYDKDGWYKALAPTVHKRYSPKQTLRRLLKYNNWGPW